MNNINLNIKEDFSSTPGPRYRHEGSDSGEQFREDFLVPKLHEAISNECSLLVILDGTEGYGTSFLEEAFGGLIRINNFEKNEILSHIEFISEEEPYLIDDINGYIEDAQISNSKK